MKDSNKLLTLQKHLDKTKVLLNNIPTRHIHRKPEYIQWVNLEIKRTENKLNQLKGL